MAAAVKKKMKEKGTNPNIVLIIFVVFLFLVTIGLGIWVYYEHDTQKKLIDSKFSSDKALKAEKDAVAYYSMLSRELRLSLGDTLTEKETEQLAVDREEFAKENYGKFKSEESKEAARKLLEEIKARLGLAENGKDVKSDFKKEIVTAEDKAKKAEAKLTALAAKQEYLEKFTVALSKDQDKFQSKVNTRLDESTAEAIKEIKKNTNEFVAQAQSNRDLNAKLVEKDDEINKIKDDNEKQVRKLINQIKAFDLQLKDLLAGGGGGGGAPVVQAGAVGNFAPLVLDVSTGKPLWDFPVGKVMRVDLDLRQVAINLGSANGAKPELTFNIFAAGLNGRAEKQLKGSIEIIKVVDAQTSLARITALYDADGREILMTDQGRGRIVRESEAPIREGDLLFNLFWGTRVAVAGYVNITGDPSDNPGEQIRQMDDFAALLQRNGMQIDAFVDLRDGKIRGALTSKTRYVILGDDLRSAGRPKAAPMAAMKEKAEGEEKDAPKDAPKEEAAGDDRAKAVKDAKDTLLRDAVQRGLLMISAENFATVIGYRRARSANNPEISAFRPSLPYAGSGVGGVMIDAPRPKVEEKGDKMMEKKEEKEKKDDN